MPCSRCYELACALGEARRERDEARALLDQQAAFHATVERIDRGAIDRCVTLGERVVALEAERDEARRHAGTLLAVVERVADRITADDGADVARLMADVARQRRAEREALARAEAERDALRAAVQVFCTNASVCFVTDCKDHPHDWRALAALLPGGVAPFLACKEDDL